MKKVKESKFDKQKEKDLEYIKEIHFEVNEENFIMELCNNDQKKKDMIKSLKYLIFGSHKISFKVNEMQLLLNDLRNTGNSHWEDDFNYMDSFELEKNFEQLVKACDAIKDKPTRINIKFETFDRKFSIYFADTRAFTQICRQLNSYKLYIFKIEKREG